MRLVSTGIIAAHVWLLVACTDTDPIGSTGAGAAGGSASSSSSSDVTSAGGATAGVTVTGSGGGGGGVAADPCAGAPDGEHCGGDLGGLADHGSVYSCAGGTTGGVTPCEAGCLGGACNQIAADPCASAQFGSGAYCGGSLIGGDAGLLYQCQGGATSGTQACSGGCQVQPPGVADSCAPVGDPCASANSGNGLYCGGTIGGDANKLYDCQGSATASSMTCANGCQVMPPGTPDQCASGGEECCQEAPPGALTQAFTACGGGGSHYGRDYGTNVGTPIYAGISGTVVGSALGYPNCYSGGCTPACWNAFNYVKVKSDCGDPDDSARDFYVYYLHIDALASGVQNGTQVNQGQLLAYSGNSGCSSGPHIHIETVSVPAGQSAQLSTCNSVDPASRFCP